MQTHTEPPPSEAPASHQDMPLDWAAFSHALLNATRDGVVAANETGVVVFANQVAIAGLELHIASDLASLKPELWRAAQKTMDERTHQLGIPISGKGGTYLAKIFPMLWKEKVIGALLVFENTTELDLITRQMLSYQHLSRELDAIIDSSSDGLWISDAQGVVKRINPASERINRIRAEQVVGRSMEQLVAEGYIDRSVTLEVIRTNTTVNMLQQTRHGEKLIVTGNPVFDEGGRLTRVVVNERDITEIDQLRHELEEREALSDQFRQEMLQMQLLEVESKRVVARSPAMVKLLRQALKVATVDSNVLITGESGVGKGMIADLIHKYSQRASRPIIKINCGAIPESLMESELFGYERGAFTGALKSGKPGYFELANGGLLFLDEIAELSPSSQVKLLRFLEDSMVTRVGGTHSRKVDVRVVAATNRDLDDMVAKGLFRRDFYYRLNVIPIRIPPLRDRREDILPLIRFYLEHFGTKFGAQKHISRAALDMLLSYPYPGNTRELINLCERLVVMSEGKRIDIDDLPAFVLEQSSRSTSHGEPLQTGKPLKELMDGFEKNVLMSALEKHRSQQSIAEALGVDQSTIARKFKKHGIKIPTPSNHTR